jgi:hypothetical protein
MFGIIRQMTDREYRPKRFAGTVDFFKNAQDRERLARGLRDKLGTSSRNTEKLQDEFLEYLLRQPGMLPGIMKENEVVRAEVFDFLLGDTDTLVLAGVSGHGKSLLATDVRRMHELLGEVDGSLQTPLAFIPWDRGRSAYFAALGRKIGAEVEVPKLANPIVLEIISRTMENADHYVRTMFPGAKTIIEVPMHGRRGDYVTESLKKSGANYKVLAVYSPEMARDIVGRGRRDVGTSGHPLAIMNMQKEVADEVRTEVGPGKSDIELLGYYWKKKLLLHPGTIVEWTPHADTERFTDTRRHFKENSMRPDELSPVHLDALISQQYSTFFDLLEYDVRQKVFESSLQHRME